MKTIVPTKRNILKTVLLVFVSALSVLTRAQVSGGNNGLDFQNYVLQSGTHLQVGAKYLFSAVTTNVDAVVSIDSLINGAKVNKIDDNSNGTGYKEALQPAVQSGNVIGLSYAVFSVKFYEQGTTIPKTLQTVNATALDLDGNISLKEFARINIGTGGITSYMTASPDISVVQVLTGDFMGQNILGIERSGIDTSALANMFTATNSGINSFSLKYGTFTINPSTAVRQFSLYMKGFTYPNSTLPVKLTSFTATLNNNNKADLKWVTSSEINVSHFVIERSTDGSNFSDAGMMFAYGTATDVAKYSFSDNLASITSPVVYYRLRSVDIDGKTEYSETRVIRMSKGKENTISILTFPNPVTNEVRVTIPSTWQNKAVSYEIFNANGQVVKRIQTASSSQTETINVSSLSRGMYIVKAVCGTEQAQERIVKQ